jgi:hypothetical protein
MQQAREKPLLQSYVITFWVTAVAYEKENEAQHSSVSDYWRQ